jgi:hypothetical protein
MSKLDILKAVAGALLFVPVFYAWLVLILAMQP